MPPRRDLRLNIRDIVSNAWPAVLSTVDKSGQPFCRSMNNLHHKDEIDLARSNLFAKEGEWTFFFRTRKSSDKVRQIHDNNRACTYYTLRQQMSAVTLLGTIRERDDSKIKQAIWQEEWENFFPYGVSDPEFTLLEFRAVEYRLFLKTDEEFLRLNGTVRELSE